MHNRGLRSAAALSGVLFVSILTAVLLVTGLGRTGRSLRAETMPNVIFIMVDALRPDHVTSYGYDRPTTPQVDEWITSQGVRFEDVTAPSSWTYPSNAATLTGRAPTRIGVDWHSNSTRIPSSEKMLAEYLKEAGYVTAGFVNAYYVWPNFGFDQGFDIYQAITSGPNGDAAKVNEAAIAWLDAAAAGDQPLFLYLYYYDPHTIYDPRPPYDLMYDATYTGTLTGDVFKNGEIVVSGEYTPTVRDIEHLKALYDGEVTYWDEQVGRMLADLEARGLLENAIVIVTADHGQMFGEHNLWTHHNSLYEEAVRVPLMMRGPGLPAAAGAVITEPVSLMDVVPTVLDLLELPQEGELDGQSLVPAMAGRAVAMDRPIISELSGETDPENPHYWISPRHELRSMKQAGGKYILQVDNPAGDALYQLAAASPYETENLIAREPEQAAAFFDAIYDYFNLPTEFGYLPLIHRD